jgi:hypothetical protein
VVTLAELSATTAKVNELFESVTSLVTVRLLLLELSVTWFRELSARVTSPSFVLVCTADAALTKRFMLPVFEFAARLIVFTVPTISAPLVVKVAD